MSALPGTGTFEQVYRGFGSILEIEVSQVGVLQIRRYSYFGGKDAAYINLSPEEAEAVDSYFRRRLGKTMSLDDMATALSVSGYLVCAPHDAMPEPLWRRIGEREGYLTSMSHVEMAELLKIAGYGIMPPPQGAEAPEVIDDDAQACAQYPPLARTPEPWPRVEDRAGLIQDRVHVEEASRPAETVRYQPEDADMPTTEPQMPQISHNGTGEGIDTPGQQEEAFSAAPAPPTVLQHCMASEARQGKTVVRQEILEELLRHLIPPAGLWSEWQRDVEQRLPGRWEV